MFPTNHREKYYTITLNNELHGVTPSYETAQKIMKQISIKYTSLLLSENPYSIINTSKISDNEYRITQVINGWFMNEEKIYIIKCETAPRIYNIADLHITNYKPKIEKKERKEKIKEKLYKIFH